MYIYVYSNLKFSNQNVTQLIVIVPVPKRVAAFPPNVIPADPVKNQRVLSLLNNAMVT